MSNEENVDQVETSASKRELRSEKFLSCLQQYIEITVKNWVLQYFLARSKWKLVLSSR